MTDTLKRTKRIATIDPETMAVLLEGGSYPLAGIPNTTRDFLALRELRRELVNTDTPATVYDDIKSGERNLAPKAKSSEEKPTDIQAGLAETLAIERGAKRVGVKTEERQAITRHALADIMRLDRSQLAQVKSRVLARQTIATLDFLAQPAPAAEPEAAAEAAE